MRADPLARSAGSDFLAGRSERRPFSGMIAAGLSRWSAFGFAGRSVFGFAGRSALPAVALPAVLGLLPTDCGAIGVARLVATGGVTAVGINVVTGERAVVLAATVTGGAAGMTPPATGAGRPAGGSRAVRSGRASGDRSGGGFAGEGGG